jgi:hypothetical protein
MKASHTHSPVTPPRDFDYRARSKDIVFRQTFLLKGLDHDSQVPAVETNQSSRGTKGHRATKAAARNRRTIMTDKTIDLDRHRGMAAQKATELRRLLAEVEANETALRLRQNELETHLMAAPAANWHEAAEKARYLLSLFAATLAAQDPRRKKLIAAVLADFDRLAHEC